MFSTPVHSARVRIGLPGANHALFTAKPSSCHVHSTLQVTPPTSPCPTVPADTEPARKHTETIFVLGTRNSFVYLMELCELHVR